MNATLPSKTHNQQRFAGQMFAALQKAGETNPIHYDTDSFELRIGDGTEARRMYLGNAFGNYGSSGFAVREIK